MNVIHYILFVLFFLTIYSIYFKTIEGFDDDFYYYDKLIEYKSMPNSYVNDSIPSRTINKFGFYKGKGTFKKGYTDETKSDEKISTLNKLLNRLLGRIVSDNQDCVGSFTKYSECDKSCGSNSYQTRTYNITKERGKNGKDCPFVDGYEEKMRCDLDECQIGDICKSNEDCETGNCNPDSTRCENMVPCDSKNFHVCNETDCINLNDDDNNDDDRKMIEGTYIYNNVDKECFFKTPAEIKKLNLNIYTYDFKTISEEIKDVVLDCEYYQVKKDGVGPCINAPNIIMEGEGDTKYPKCSPGYGPEPTIFNGLNACQKCIIDYDSRISRDICLCKNGGIYNNASETCGEVNESDPTDNLCQDTTVPLWFVKRKKIGAEDCMRDNGELCPSEYQFRKVDSVVSCVACPAQSNTFSNYCSTLLSTLNSDLCGEQNFKENYLEKIDGGVVDNLEEEDYYEKCITGLSDSLTDCGDYQTRIGEHCVCTGDGMNRKPPGCSDDDCFTQADVQRCNASNCLSGYHAGSDEVFTCVKDAQCQSQQHCSTPDDGECIDVSGSIRLQPCLVCADGYDKNGSGICACDTGFHMNEAGNCSSCTTGYYGQTDSDGNLICNQCPETRDCIGVCTNRMDSNWVSFCKNCCEADCSPSNWLNTIDCRLLNTGR